MTFSLILVTNQNGAICWYNDYKINTIPKTSIKSAIYVFGVNVSNICILILDQSQLSNNGESTDMRPTNGPSLNSLFTKQNNGGYSLMIKASNENIYCL